MHHNTFTAGARYVVPALIFILISMLGITAAQDAPPVITIDNIHQLQSIAQLNFDELPAEAGVVDKGWFAVSGDGEQYALVNRDNGINFWSISQGFESNSVAMCDDEQGTFVDGGFHPEDNTAFIAAYIQGSASYFGFHKSTHSLAVRFCGLDGLLLRTWQSEDQAWAEMMPLSSTEKVRVMNFPLLYGLSPDAEWNTNFIASSPENDPEAFLRIGRIDPPLTVTVTREGLFKRWNLETGEVTAEAQIDSLPAAGQMNADGSHLAWVDQDFDTLHLLNFETGEDQLVADLEGIYIPFLLLTPDADVIIAVNVEYQPTVIAWDVATGERIELGEYRACNRPQPDMVRLSKDGRTLVIGCDTGLDIWRIVEN